MTACAETYTRFPDSAFSFVSGGDKNPAREILKDIHNRRRGESIQQLTPHDNAVDDDISELNDEANFYQGLNDAINEKLQLNPESRDKTFQEYVKTIIQNEVDISINHDLDIEQILEALSDSRWDFRTITGIAKQTGVSKDRVAHILNQNKHEVRKSLVPNKHGEALYTLISRKKSLREIASEFRLFLSKSI